LPRAGGDDYVNLKTHELSREPGEGIEFSVCISIFDDNRFAVYIPKLT
jgi:hypothetical protein